MQNNELKIDRSFVPITKRKGRSTKRPRIVTEPLASFATAAEMADYLSKPLK